MIAIALTGLSCERRFRRDLLISALQSGCCITKTSRTMKPAAMCCHAESAGRQRSYWKPDELVTLTRLLLAGGYGDAASRFLYTLTIQGQLKPGSELRARCA